MKKNLKIGVIAAAAVLLSISQPNVSYSQENLFYHSASVEDSVQAKTILRKVPYDFGKIVESHVRKMFKERYALGMNEDDLFHGHLFRDANAKPDYDSLEGFLSQIGIVLYHTDENGMRWKRSQDSPYERKQRSIVGKKDGSIETAIDYAGLRDSTFTYDYMKNDFREVGTVSTFEIANKRKDMEGGSQNFAKIPDPQGLEEGGFSPYYYIFINPEENGRFKASGVRFDVYINLNSRREIEVFPKQELFLPLRRDTSYASPLIKSMMRLNPKEK